jgi:hypothetical protein
MTDIASILVPVDSQQSLMDSLQFTESDLSANRNGKMSAAQKEAFGRTWRRGLAIRLVILVITILIATTFLYVGQTAGSPAFTLLGITMTICNAVIVGQAAQAYLRYSGDTGRQPVIEQEGNIERILRINQRARTSAYFIRLGEHEIRVTKPVFNAFVEGGRYRVYRAPVSKIVLSAEAL